MIYRSKGRDHNLVTVGVSGGSVGTGLPVAVLPCSADENDDDYDQNGNGTKPPSTQHKT
jgi:hypothetical protein